MPHLNSKRVNSFLIFLTLLACCFALRCDTKNLRANHQILAIVEKKTIDATAFIQRFEDFRRKTGAEDNGLTRRSVLRNLVDEEILIYEARKRQYDIDEPGQAELARIKVQELLNHFHQHFIGNKIQVNDDELKQLFINLNTKIKARHIYAPTKRQADSLFNILNHGASFEEVAQTCFNDPVLKESGGSLGYFTVDEMDPAFEEAAFSLKIGEISPPIRTVDGYSIIRVDDRLGNPLVTESEFAKHRAKLAAYWHQRKTNKMTQKYVDSLRHELKIKFNEDIIQKLFSNLKDRKKNYASPENEILNTSAQDLDDEALLESKLGKWNVRIFREHAKFSSDQQQNWIRNIENLKDFLAGLVVRAYMLKEAKQRKLHKSAEYQNKAVANFEVYLLERIEKTLYNDFPIPEDSLQSYFNDDPNLFAEPTKVRLQEIVLSSKKSIELISAQLKRNVSFSLLAQQYSVNKQSAEKGGDLGFLEAKDLGKWAKEILAMNIGDWAGPMEMNAYFVFLKCTDKIPAQLRTYHEAKPDIEEAVRAVWWHRIRENKIKEIRSGIAVASFPDKLTLLKIN